MSTKLSATIELSSYSGGAAPEGLYGSVTLRIDGELVRYLREPLWQPIETAPAGPAILAFANGELETSVNAADHLAFIKEIGMQDDPAERATHWMPLPAAPSQKA